MVSAMMRQGMSIDKNALMDMARAVTGNLGANPETVVLMKALNIPVTPENIQQFENYQSYKHQLLANVTDILMDIPKAFQSMAASGHGEQMQKPEGMPQGQEQETAGTVRQGGEEAETVRQQMQADMDRELAGIIKEGGGQEKEQAAAAAEGTEGTGKGQAPSSGESLAAALNGGGRLQLAAMLGTKPAL